MPYCQKDNIHVCERNVQIFEIYFCRLSSLQIITLSGLVIINIITDMKNFVTRTVVMGDLGHWCTISLSNEFLAMSMI